MNRDRFRVALVALLAVVVIAVGGATLDSPVAPGSPDRDPGVGDGERPSSPWTPFDFADSEETEEGTGGETRSTMGLCIEFLQHPLVILGMLALVGLASIPFYRRVGVLGVVSVYLIVLPFGTLVYAFLTKCRPRPSGARLPTLQFGQNNSSMGSGAGNGTGAGGGMSGVDPPIVLLAVGALLVVALVAAFLRATGDDGPPEEEVAPDDPDEDVLAGIGEAAGDAADRIEGERGFENEVYRAWREMTTLLDVPNPEASTPGEFARAATDAGMDRGHVDALTDCFREVRYGGAEPTAEREAQAVDALRRIETAYGGNETEYGGEGRV